MPVPVTPDPCPDTARNRRRTVHAGFFLRRPGLIRARNQAVESFHQLFHGKWKVFHQSRRLVPRNAFSMRCEPGSGLLYFNHRQRPKWPARTRDRRRGWLQGAGSQEPVSNGQVGRSGSQGSGLQARFQGKGPQGPARRAHRSGGTDPFARMVTRTPRCQQRLTARLTPGRKTGDAEATGFTARNRRNTAARLLTPCRVRDGRLVRLGVAVLAGALIDRFQLHRP